MQSLTLLSVRRDESLQLLPVVNASAGSGNDMLQLVAKGLNSFVFIGDAISLLETGVDEMTSSANQNLIPSEARYANTSEKF